MTVAWVLLVVAVAVIAVAVVRRNRRADPVDSFRRQIDALSPEARKPTVDKVRDAAEDSDETGVDDS